MIGFPSRKQEERRKYIKCLKRNKIKIRRIYQFKKSCQNKQKYIFEIKWCWNKNIIYPSLCKFFCQVQAGNHQHKNIWMTPWHSHSSDDMIHGSDIHQCLDSSSCLLSKRNLKMMKQHKNISLVLHFNIKKHTIKAILNALRCITKDSILDS